MSGTEVVLETRAVKSAEELGFLREAARLAELAAAGMLAVAKEGVPENLLYAEMVRVMLANGGELPTMIYWGAGSWPASEHLVPSTRRLEKGDVLSNEIEAKYGGYIAQVAAPAVVGSVPREQHAMYEASLRIFNELSLMIRPGVPLAEVGRAYQRLVQEAELKPMSWPFHGRGLGDDHPAMANAAAAQEAVFAENHVIILKPGVAYPDSTQDAGERAGDTVVVTPDGCRRLGQRPLRISEIPLL